jgi:uncharacterized protein YdiU (UPF0061 family)
VVAIFSPCIEHYYPQCQGAQKYVDFFNQVVKRTAKMLADWQAQGFAHGVMNTDNMSILGLTIDYGPHYLARLFE